MLPYSVHGVNYIRKGKCNRCGECEKPDCPHLSIRDGISDCLIHDRKKDVCESCTKDKNGMWYRKGKPVTHFVCCCFPDQPFLRVIKEGLCGYKFEPATDKDAVRHKELIEAWQ